MLGVNAIHELKEQATEKIHVCDQLSEKHMWAQHDGTSIWKARQFVGTPHFYPVYRYEDFYSYSPLSLILLKGTLRLNRRVAEDVAKPHFIYYSGRDTVDQAITRIGGPLRPRLKIREPNFGFAISDCGFECDIGNFRLQIGNLEFRIGDCEFWDSNSGSKGRQDLQIRNLLSARFSCFSDTSENGK